MNGNHLGAPPPPCRNSSGCPFPARFILTPQPATRSMVSLTSAIGIPPTSHLIQDRTMARRRAPVEPARDCEVGVCPPWSHRVSPTSPSLSAPKGGEGCVRGLGNCIPSPPL